SRPPTAPRARSAAGSRPSAPRACPELPRARFVRRSTRAAASTRPSPTRGRSGRASAARAPRPTPCTGRRARPATTAPCRAAGRGTSGRRRSASVRLAACRPGGSCRGALELGDGHASDVVERQLEEALAELAEELRVAGGEEAVLAGPVPLVLPAA